MKGHTNQEKASASHATERKPGPAKRGAQSTNPVKGGGINRATAGKR